MAKGGDCSHITNKDIHFIVTRNQKFQQYLSYRRLFSSRTAQSAALPRIPHVAFIGGPLCTPFSEEAVTKQLDLARLIAEDDIMDSLLPALTSSTSMETGPLAVALVRPTVMAQTKDGYAGDIKAFAEGVSMLSSIL